MATDRNTAHTPYTDYNLADWGISHPPNDSALPLSSLPNAYLAQILATLQRIANLLDPEVQENKRLRKERTAIRERWEELLDERRWFARRLIKAFDAKGSYRQTCVAIGQRIQDTLFATFDEKLSDYQPATDDDVQEIARIRDSFDPLTFNYCDLHLNERLTERLNRLQNPELMQAALQDDKDRAAKQAEARAARKARHEAEREARHAAAQAQQKAQEEARLAEAKARLAAAQEAFLKDQQAARERAAKAAADQAWQAEILEKLQNNRNFNVPTDTPLEPEKP